MHVIISGGSGFLGRALTSALTRSGHRVSVLTRQARPGHPGDIAWTPGGQPGDWAQALSGADAVVNLAGAGMADRRWTAARKAELLGSRVDATTSLATALLGISRPPPVFLSGSGVGVYGPRGDELIAEGAAPGTDFVARMACAWETAATPASRVSRVAYLRTGLVLGAEGALAKMRTPFRLGVGGRLGHGRQWMPWIHVDDWVGLVVQLLTDDRASGPVNLTAPAPVTNAEFTRTLGRALRRPAVMPVPAAALRLVLGEMADLLLTGQRAVPARAEALGYLFRYAALPAALAAIEA